MASWGWPWLFSWYYFNKHELRQRRELGKFCRLFLTLGIAIDTILVSASFPTGSTELWVIANPVLDRLALVSRRVIPIGKTRIVDVVVVAL